jgi:hypothetical protein
MALPLTPESQQLMRVAVEKYMQLSAEERRAVCAEFRDNVFLRSVPFVKLRDAVAVPCDTATPHRPDRAGP